ncbi:MAG TPA: lamin tail domain-containing protein [Verrucomicrobiae bacterium]|nr:lamin tail domain-containing protein [Verrucomicrobiae bacterium]
MTPLAVTGFNLDVVLESTASGPPYFGYAVELRPGEGQVYYEAGLPGKGFGLPVGGSFVSEVGDNTTFQLEPYTSNNALVLSTATGLTQGTLTLATAQTFSRIAVIANSSSGGGAPNVTLNFNDGSSFTTTYNAQDWFNNPNFALSGFERINLNNGGTSGTPGNPRFYQTTIDLAALLGLANKPLVSITFDKVASAGATAVYAVSGEVAPPTPAIITAHPSSTNVVEATAATFRAAAAGVPSPTVQWLRNGAPILGATNSTYTFFAALADHNSVYRMVASNFVSSVSQVVTSGPATLTVTADTTRPVLLGAQSFGLTQVLARYSERVQPNTATNIANYSLVGTNGPRAISGVVLDPLQSNVVLTVAAMTDGAPYTLTVNNVADQSVAANTVTNNSQANFLASIYANVGIGSPTPAGSQTPVGNGLNISGGGADVGGSSDQYQFSYVQRTGDFDVKVRLDSLSLADAWSEAGMIAREALSPGASSVSVMATPSISGCYFQSRGASNGPTSLSGSFPVNYPNTWLRLRRVGNDFTGYAGIDGQNWTQLGTASLALPATVHFGFAVASHNAGELATAAFRDFGNATGAAENGPLPFETLGQSSRRTSLVISEIMYHPTNPQLEFVEIFNTRGEPEDLSDYRLRGDVSYDFPPGTMIPGGGFLVVAKAPVDLQSAYGIGGVLGPFTGSLPNSAGIVQLENQIGGVFLQVEYEDEPPWPVAADGTGHSLVLARPSYGENDPRAWAASDVVGGTPGRLNSFTADPLRNVFINEFLAHTDDPEQDYIELYNHSTQPVSIAGCVLSDDPELDKYVIPGGVTIPANGFVSFNQTTLGFSLSADGETIYFKNAARTRVIDAVRFDGQENGVSMGRWPDGATEFYRLVAKTPGTNNAAIRASDVVINELMYHPITENDDDQYIELFNRSALPVNLSGWTLGGGVSFTFPSNTTIAGNGYVVVANVRSNFLANYPGVNPNLVFGDWSGNLSGGGERVTLGKPDSLISTNGSVVATNFFRIVVDEVTYEDGGRWGEWADGGGSSLERIDPRANGRLPSNWADSNETQKAPWKLVSATGTIDNGNVSADQLQVLLQGAGECLIDDVQVIVAGVNRIPNSTFEGDASGWTAEGTQSLSSHETTEGFGSARSYHVRAVERGDNQINRIRTPLTSAIASGTTNVTIRANVRWLKGHPEILFRLRGNWLECVGEMALPVSPGTPGAANSRLVVNAPPAITEVQHSPVLPAANQPFVVTARVHDPDGVSSLQLGYRIDPGTFTFVPMNDNGTAGDAVPRDGIFTATVPAQPAGTMVAFYVQAVDGFSAASTFPNDAPARECYARVGEVQPTGNFPAYRLWMSQNTLNTWASRPELNNSPFDVTFVLNNQRAIYNTKALYAGSPYIAPSFSSPVAGRCGYSIDLPKDDLFLGDDGLVLDWPGGHGNETTAMQEQMAYWIANKLNLPYSHRYIIRLHVNGVTDDARSAVFEAVHQPGSSFLEQWMPNDPDGPFFKVDRAFEFNDGGGLVADPQPRMQIFNTTGGVKKREKYRWWFMYRATDRVNDYNSIFALADALNASDPEPYTSATFGLVDVEQWMRIFATEHIIVNFDSWGHAIGKNMYMYKPLDGKWQLYMFDLDWLMLVAAPHGAGGPPNSAPLFNSEDPTISRMYAHPPFARAYWRAVEDAINGPFNLAKYGPVMDAKYQSLRANGIVWCDGQPLTDPTGVKLWFNARRTFLQNQLATVASAFTVSSSSTVSNGVATITGTAPVGVATITINGVPWQVRWTSVSNWVATVPLQTGANLFNVVGLDTKGQPIPGATGNVSVNYAGSVPSPVNAVVINEIMFNPSVPDAEYIELFNTSSNFTFDLSGWEVNGLSYNFPGGSFIAPRSYLVLTKDRTPFMTAYGASIPVYDGFAGNLQSNGETVSLLKPGAATNSPLVVDRVRYEAVSPWPVITNGAALQLQDAAQDNSRVANWSVGATTVTTPQSIPLLTYTDTWKFMQVSNLDGVNWTAPAFNDAAWPSGAGLLAFESNGAITPLINTTLKDPRIATNNVTSGHAYYFRATVNVPTNLTGFTINASGYIDDGAVIYVNGTEATRIRMPAGTITNASLTQGGQQPPSGDATSPESFTLPAAAFSVGPNTIAVSVHQNVTGSSDIAFALRLDANLAGGSNGLALATPGTANSVATTLAAFPTLWLNEAQADNVSGPLDNFGQHEPWVEIYNPGPSPLSLTGYSLSTNYANPGLWSFPAGTSVPAGGFLIVWCDGQTAQSVAGVPHTSFRLSSGSGRIALSRSIGGTNQIVDYLTYTDLPSNWSYGDLPDGQPFFRGNMFFATPGATNNASLPPLNVYINEWMADNTLTAADPADGGFEDWFEIYNPGPNPANLGGYWLTDNLANKFQFQIPNNGHYIIPPGGYLVVWADNEDDQNSTNLVDLHASFALSKGGEALGLFASDGTTIDAITFGAQTSDVSEGRYVDGSANIYAMTTPTPGGPNFLPNTAPSLAPIANKEITLGQTLTFTANATDSDIPAQTLTYSLGAGAAPGATIGSLSGTFNWTPSTAPGTNTFSIIVTDSGVPSLTATQSFSVVVYPRASIAVQMFGSQMLLSWPRGTLQQADEATGPFVDMAVTSPYFVNPTEARKFFRIRF